MKCNLCGNENFKDMNTRKDVVCTECGSLERTRLLWMYIQNVQVDKNSKVLHIAPEQGLYNAFTKLVRSENYIVADINPENYRFADKCRRIDLCDLEDQPSCEYDLIVHSHVLEHTPCNIAYSLFHLHRMLKDSGVQVCIIPFMSGKYDECYQDLSHEERNKRFGQFDHVRRFGKEDFSSHLGKIMKPRSKGEKWSNDANIPETHWRGLHVSTVLTLKKSDYKLQV